MKKEEIKDVCLKPFVNSPNSLLSEGFIPVDEQKPKHYDDDGEREWVLAAWSNNEQRLKVFADKIGTDSCSADYWKPLD